jgi:acyl carrier protein
MKEAEIRKELLALIQPRMEMLGIRERELKKSFDLVSSGFVNSMEFVELVSDLEGKCGVEIDFDRVTESNRFTTIGGLVELFMEYLGK